MGRVFLGLSAGGRPVAVKVIRADLAADPEFRVRFRREVAAARKVSGMFTALVVDADVDGPVPWLATAYVSGPSVSEAVARCGPMSTRSVLALAAGLAEGLSAIHAAGVVHCDLKPSNVLLSQDGPRVIDFGISRAAADAAVTGAGPVIGSPGFMSPEQALGEEVGPAGDVFSLGAVLAFAATGRGPFGAGAAPEVAYRVVYSAPDLEDLPAELRPLVDRCLAKDPSQRPTADDLLVEVAALQPPANWLPDAIMTAFTQHHAADPVALTESQDPPADAAPPFPAERWPVPPLPVPPTARPSARRQRPGTRRRSRRQLAAAWAGGAILAGAFAAGLVFTGSIGHSAVTQYPPTARTSAPAASSRTHTATGKPSQTAQPPSAVAPAAAALPGPGTSGTGSRSPWPTASGTASRSPTSSPSASPSRSASASPSPSLSSSASPSPSTTPPPSPSGSATSPVPTPTSSGFRAALTAALSAGSGR